MKRSDQGLARGFIRFSEASNRWVAKVTSYIVVIMMASICYEVFCRYVIESPTDWSLEINQYLLCALSLLGGGYCLVMDQHVRVDFLFRHLSRRRQAVLELCTWWLGMLFCGVLIWRGGQLAIEAFLTNRLSDSVLELPLYPGLVMIPIGSLLLLMQILSRMLQNILLLRHGGEGAPPAPEHTFPGSTASR
ncbi:MAG: TRAP transporter small permease subunit [Desulfarculus sp.]|jgi:TRAP-type mannitol/chloroaromatic compound transport system permease small subunit|nr:MAG: TRAP transporter small permease subunit [Desulfarculus sp.]